MSELFPLGKENYCPECFFNGDTVVLKTECPHAQPAEPVAQEKITAKAILADPRELFLNTPVGFPFAERIEKNEVGRIKSFLIQVFVGSEDKPGGWGDAIRTATHEELIDTCLNNNWSFDPEFFGLRQLDVRPDGQPVSRLDDPNYRRSIGLAG